jgi:drug/metabolite transporter (DMT)-like permease
MKYGMMTGFRGVNLISPSLIFIFLNPYILSGIILYLISMFFWINVLSKIDLSVAYPFVSIGVILTVILASITLSENIPVQRWIGIFIILFGVYLIVSSHKNKKENNK